MIHSRPCKIFLHMQPWSTKDKEVKIPKKINGFFILIIWKYGEIYFKIFISFICILEPLLQSQPIELQNPTIITTTISTWLIQTWWFHSGPIFHETRLLSLLCQTLPPQPDPSTSIKKVNRLIPNLLMSLWTG